MISFLRTPAAHAAAMACACVLGSAPAVAAPKKVTPPPVFPLALAQDVLLPAMPLGAPALGAGRAVVVTPDGDVTAFDLATGSEAWRAAVKATHPAVVAGDAVFVVTADSTECLGLDDGAVRWRTPRGHPATAPPLVAGSSLIVATAEPSLVALSASTGEVSWTRQLPAPVVQGLLASNGRVYGISQRHEVLAFDPSSGATAWSVPFQAALSGLAVSSERVFVGSDDNFFYALNAGNGRIDWKWRTGADVVGAAVVDADRVYFVSLDNLLRALDRNSGGQRWKHPLPSRSTAGPLLLDQVLIVVGYSPDVRGHVPATGAPAGRYGLDSEVAFLPGFAAGAWPGADRLVVVTIDRHLLVLKRRLEAPLAPLTALPGAPVTAIDPPAPALPVPPALP